MMRPYRTIGFLPAILALLPFVVVPNFGGIFEQEEYNVG